MQSLLLPVFVGVAVALAGALLFVLMYTRNQRRSATSILGVAEADADRIRSEAQRESEAARSELLVTAKMETLKLREDLEREIQRRREEWDRLERRAEERARAQERKLEEIDLRERGAAHREEALTQRESSLRSREGEADRLAQEQRLKLERIAGLSAEDARREILQRVEDEARARPPRSSATSRNRPAAAPTAMPSGSLAWPYSGSGPSTPRRAPWPRWRFPVTR